MLARHPTYNFRVDRPLGRLGGNPVASIAGSQPLVHNGDHSSIG